MDEYEARREQRREDERRYQGDVAYDVWRAGGNMDRVDRERVSQYHNDGMLASDAAHRELRAQRPPTPPEEEPMEEQDPDLAREDRDERRALEKENP